MILPPHLFDWLVLLAIALGAGSGLPGLFLDRRPPGAGKTSAGQVIATVLLLAAAACGLAGAIGALVNGDAGLVLPWALPLPGVRFAVAIDGLSAVFLLPIFVVLGLGSIYGLGYWRQGDHPGNGRRLRFFYGVLCGGMALVVIARTSPVFITAWEVMALAAFFLVTTEDDDARVREAGWVYLVATHIGTLFLLGLFGLLFAATGSLLLLPLPAEMGGALPVALFVLGLCGFGLKAGIMPLHVWLPGAHANAPSHVSAAMSGVMIKMGVYGLCRVLSLLPHPPAAFGEVLLVLGIVSAVLGMAYAHGQGDLKRMLAYCSIENIGIILLGLGLAMLGRAQQRADWVVLGLCGALLHVWNHGLFKSLLFFSAGAVIHASHTRDTEAMGGLLPRMPRTALCFLVGSVAICGLPPLNGFVSELCIYAGLIRAVATGTDASLPFMSVVFAAPALALTGALSLSCFVKVFGAVFLGQERVLPRGPRPEPPGAPGRAAHAHDPGAGMLLPMALLALLCLLVGLGAPLVAPVVERAVADFAPELQDGAVRLGQLLPLPWLSVLFGGLLAGFLIVGLALSAAVRGARRDVPTWDCGYAAPRASMQYTASSFSQMLVDLLSWALRPKVSSPPTRPGTAHLFPREWHFHSQLRDQVLDGLILPAFHRAGDFFSRFRFLQQGHVHAYIFYIFATLIVLLWR